MIIRNTFFDRYLEMVTVGYFQYHTEAPTDVTKYRSIIEKMKRCAVQFQELDVLKVAFDYYLSHPEISFANHGGRFPYTDAEVREIIRYARSVVWPDNPPIDEEAVNSLQFTPDPVFELRQRWNQQKDQALKQPA